MRDRGEMFLSGFSVEGALLLSQELMLFFLSTRLACLSTTAIGLLFPRDGLFAAEAHLGVQEIFFQDRGLLDFSFYFYILDGVKRPVRLGALGIGNGI